MLFFRKKTVPKSNETKEIDVVQLWEVRWRSRNGEYHNCTKNEVEVFTSEEQAKYFKISLENAFKLIKHTSGNEVYLKKHGNEREIL